MVHTMGLTPYEGLSLIVSLLGFGSVAFTIILLARQTTLLQRSIESSAYGTVVVQLLDVEKIYFNHPELRPYFY